jgi:uncharacterized protein YlxW (UPF0749 family)
MSENQTGTETATRSSRRWLLPIAILAALLGFAVVAQIRATDEDPLASARQTDLVRILGDLDTQADRLRQEISELTAAQAELVSGAPEAEALAQAQRRTEVLSLLAGTVPAEGPGVVVRLSGADISAAVVLDAVQELRDAGAEVIQIGDVRLVASSSFADGTNGGLVVDGTTLESPYRLLAIGDGRTLEAALRIPGGLVDGVAAAGGSVDIQAVDRVRIDAVVAPVTPEFAEPVAD